MKKINKILIANRGEIAIRVMRTARDMGINTVAVYSDADKDALFVKTADEAIGIGGTHASESYLVQDKIIAAAKQVGADAIHPGMVFCRKIPRLRNGARMKESYSSVHRMRLLKLWVRK